MHKKHDVALTELQAPALWARAPLLVGRPAIPVEVMVEARLRLERRERRTMQRWNVSFAVAASLHRILDFSPVVYRIEGFHVVLIASL